MKWIGLGVAAIIVMLVAAEFWLRANVGDRNLFMVHPTIEYMNAPNQDVRYRGKRIAINSHNMRSAEFATPKPADVFRVLVIGDSVIFGVYLDQSELATTRLSAMHTRDGRRIEALNIAATSWGPGNQLAFLDAFGTFEADAAILESSTDDINDDRTFTPILEAQQPTHRMPLQILEPLRRFDAPVPVRPEPPGTIAGDARASLPKLLDKLATLPGSGCLIAHEKTDDRKSPTLSAGAQELQKTAEAHYGAFVADRNFLDTSRDYFDNIHLTASGQASLLKAMLACRALEGAH